MEDYSSSSEEQSDESFQGVPSPSNGGLGEIFRTMIEDNIPGLYGDPRRLMELIASADYLSSDEETDEEGVRARGLEQFVVRTERDENYVRPDLIQVALVRAITGMRGNDELLTSINKINSISKFNPGDEFDAPPCYKLVPKKDLSKWHRVALGTVQELCNSGMTANFSINPKPSDFHDMSSYYFFNEHNVQTGEVVPHATIYAESDTTMGFRALMFENISFPLLVVHLAKTIGHGCYHVRNNYPLIVWSPDDRVPRSKNSPEKGTMPVIGMEINNDLYSVQLDREEQVERHKDDFVELISYLKQQGFIERARCKLVCLMYKSIWGHDAYIYATSRDSYIFCPEEVRQNVVDILVAYGGVYLGKAKELYGLDLVNSFDNYFVSADSLVSKACLVHPLGTTFNFGQPQTPIDEATYRELASTSTEQEQVSAEVQNDSLAEGVRTVHYLMSHLSSTVRPDLEFCVDTVYWNSDSRPNRGNVHLNFDAFRTTFIYLMHTSDSSIRYSLPPTEFSEWQVDCYLAYLPKADPKMDSCAFVLMLNSEPLFWRRYDLDRAGKDNDRLAVRLMALMLERAGVFPLLSSMSGNEEIPVRYITDRSIAWLENFKELNPTLRNPTLVCVEPQDNLALFLLRGAFGDSFKEQLRKFCMV
ncbi:hypothetical protein B9G98_01289 [Wickerhamiella sorbophila]|uniref:Uncharacterized protein n=1 Tax=Wickerhamiella sorbophila TaxID=45607 RepID=A0A2T0FFD2_9ASCO|nr:hypothetical protein B9G98_01289 [Wickerhamiella sorbophila]PRT53669.1 hypothetical protein B9G98_01289 [Wickerhamiella sorbophila]